MSWEYRSKKSCQEKKGENDNDQTLHEAFKWKVIEEI